MGLSFEGDIYRLTEFKGAEDASEPHLMCIVYDSERKAAIIPTWSYAQNFFSVGGIRSMQSDAIANAFELKLDPSGEFKLIQPAVADILNGTFSPAHIHKGVLSGFSS
jgi:hypothetical protein